MLKRVLPILVAAMVIIFLLLYFALRASFIAGDTPVVKTVVIRPEQVPLDVEFEGTVRVREGKQVLVTARWPGRIQRICVSPGDQVKAGDFLAEFDQRDLLLQRQQAQARLDMATAQLRQKERMTRQEVVAASLGVAEANYEYAKKQFQITTELFQEGAVPRDTLDQAFIRLKDAEAAYLSAKNSLDYILKGNTPDDIMVLAAQVREAQAALQMVDNQINDSRIRSPVTGTVVQKEVQEGSSVTAGTLLFAIADLSDLVVEVEVEEDKLWAWKPGTEMVISGDAFGGRRVNGTIEKVLPVASTETIAANKAKFRAYVVPANPDDLLLPGLTVSLRFAKTPTRMGFKVPVGAILDDTDKAKSVFVVEDGRAKKKRIRVGTNGGSRVEVISGLSPGDEVIVEGHEKLQDGQIVRSVRN